MIANDREDVKINEGQRLVPAKVCKGERKVSRSLCRVLRKKGFGDLHSSLGTR
jgi:hypothetical protein